MRLDFLAGEPHFIHHLVPVWKALPENLRGEFIIRKSIYARVSLGELVDEAKKAGIPAVTEPADPERPILVASWGDQKDAQEADRIHIARMEHGIGQAFIGSDASSYAGGARCEQVGLWLCPNDYSASRWKERYPHARVAIVGCPKLDTLPKRRAGPKPVIAVSFHWGLASPDPNDPLIETYGAWGEYREAVMHLARRYRIIGHGHPRMLQFLARYYRRYNVPVVESFAEVCRQADLYVCDTNSTIYEFASTGRPVVVVNGSHFRRDVNHGLRFDWGPVTNVGVQCDSPYELATAVAQALEDTPEQRKKREAALDIVYAYRTGAADRAAKAIGTWLRSLARQRKAAA